MLTWLRAIPAIALFVLAASSEAKSHSPKVMVLDLTHDESLKPSTMATLNGFLAGAVRDEGFTVITPSQIGAVLGLERQKQLLGCAESSCLAEIGGAMGVDFIVQGTVSIFSRSSALTLTLVDQRGIAVASQRKLVQGTDTEAFIPAITALVPKLMAAARPAGAPGLSSPPEVAQNGPAGGLQSSQEVEQRTSPHPTGAYVLVGTGVALLAGSVVAGLMASSEASAFKTDQQNARPDLAKSDQSSANTLALASTVATGAGVLALGSGLVWYFGGSSDSGGAQ